MADYDRDRLEREKERDKANLLQPDTIMHIEYEEANKLALYKKAFEVPEPDRESLSEEEKEKFRESYRHFYFAADIVPNAKSIEFFDDVLREVHSTMKIKANSKAILRSYCQVFLRELAENCVQILNEKGDTGEILPEMVADAYERMRQQKQLQHTFGHLFH